MSAKYFCDQCGDELSKKDYGRIKRKKGRIEIEVLVGIDGTWNSGHACHKCVIDAVVIGKDVRTEQAI